MKLISSIFVLAVSSVTLMAQAPKVDYKQLNKQAAKEYLKPVRPGYEGRNPYWNGFAKRFIYAPAFDFKSVDGACDYLYTLTVKGRAFQFTAKAPNLSLSPIWSKVPVGDASLKVVARDKSGKEIAVAGEREFYRDFPYCGPYTENVRPYKEAAIKALLYLHHQKPVLKFENSQEPDMSWWQFAYPCKTVSAIIRCELMLAGYSEKQKTQAEKIARNCGDFLMSISQKPGEPLAYFPPTYYGNQKASGTEINKGKTMSMEAAKAAMAFLDLYDYTRERKYFDHAIGIVSTYARCQRENGSIPMKFYYDTAEPVNEVNASLHPLLYVLRRLQDQYKMNDFAEVKAKAEHWMETEGYKGFELVGQFEDVPIEDVKPYENLTHWTGLPYVTYALENGDVSKEFLALAKDVMDFSEDQFVIWDQEANEDGIRTFQTPCTTEQYDYWVPIDDSAMDLATAWLEYYKKTGDKLSFVKAKAMYDKLTLVQYSNSGIIPTVWKLSYGSVDNSFWPSCMMISIQSLLAFSEFMGE